jgi:hypothetical protein
MHPRLKCRRQAVHYERVINKAAVLRARLITLYQELETLTAMLPDPAALDFRNECLELLRDTDRMNWAAGDSRDLVARVQTYIRDLQNHLGQ